MQVYPLGRRFSSPLSNRWLLCAQIWTFELLVSIVFRVFLNFFFRYDKIAPNMDWVNKRRRIHHTRFIEAVSPVLGNH